MSEDILPDLALSHPHVIRLHNGGAGIAAVPTIQGSHSLDLRDAPGLRWTATRASRLVTVVDFGNRVQAADLGRLRLKNLDQASAISQRSLRRSERRQIGIDERSEQPRPNRTLMVGAITLNRRALVAWPVVGIAWLERPETYRSQQLLLHDAHDCLLPIALQQAVRQADGEDLIGAQFFHRTFVRENVIQAVPLRVPELRAKTI